MKAIAVISAFFFAVLLLAVIDIQGCKTFTGTIQSIEQMPEDQFAFQEARIGRLTRGIVALAVLDPKSPISPADVVKVADAIDRVANDLTTTGNADLLINALKLAGITDQRVIILVGLIQDFFPEAFTWGDGSTLLGPHARDMLKTIATAMRVGAGSPVPEAEKFEAKMAAETARQK